MKNRPLVWHAIGVLMVLSLMAPSFLTVFNGSAASVAPAVEVQQPASIAGIGPSQETAINSIAAPNPDMTVASLPYPGVINRLPFNVTYPITQGPQAAHCTGLGLSHIEGSSGTANERAIDIATPNRTPIYAAGDGRIQFEGWEYGMIIVRIEHAGGVVSWYVHLSESIVWTGDWVTSGQFIGYSGDTGAPGAHHLHFAATMGATTALHQ